MIGNEREWLVAALRGEMCAEHRALTNEVGTMLIQAARLNGVEALTAFTLQDAGTDVPADTSGPLQEAMRHQAAAELYLKHDLSQLGDSLYQGGLQALLLKGSALAYTHYPEPWLRPRVDTDIFIDSSDIHSIRNVFEDLGYQFHGQVYKSHQFNAYKQGPGGVVANYDIHWRASNATRYARVLEFGEMYRRSVVIEKLPPWRTLCPQDALLLACMHRLGNPNHDPDRLIWLYDIHLLFKGLSETEQLQFAVLAANHGVAAEVLGGLRKVSEVFGLDLATDVLQTLQDSTAKQGDSSRYSDSHLALLADDLRELPDMKSRVAMIGEFIWPSSDYLLQRYQARSRWSLPWLYVRYLFSGAVQRLSLR